LPGHVQVFNQGLHSYRDLPIRYGEFGSCHRNEPSGALHGILRVRGFTQDDGHIFCTEEQIEAEVRDFHAQALKVYSHFGFQEIQIKIALRPDQRIGDDATWDKAEETLRARCGLRGWNGRNCRARVRSTVPRSNTTFGRARPGLAGRHHAGRFHDAGPPGRRVRGRGQPARHVPVMLHRAIVGSMERFIGILIEHHAGQFPVWLAPLQAVVLNITDAQADFAAEAMQALVRQGFRVEADLRNEKIGYKIREHTLNKVPYLLVVGDREKEAGQFAVRARSGEDLGSMSIQAFAERLKSEASGA
jgi:threonyl-tRNA synthetase